METYFLLKFQSTYLNIYNLFMWFYEQLEVERKAKGRTGWPSEVWSTELKKKLNDSNPNQNHSTTSPPTGGKVKIVNDMIMLNSHSHSQGHGLNGKSLKSSYHGSNDYMVKYNNGKQSASSALSTTNNPNTYTFSGNDFNRMCKSNYYSNLNENTWFIFYINVENLFLSLQV